MTETTQDPIASDEIMMPWESLFPKQVQLFNTGIEDDCRVKHPNCPPAVLVDGPRRSSKTIGVCHRILRHLWETPAARVALIVKTVGSATDGGVWLDLVDIIIPQWLDSNFGFEYTTFDRDGNPGPKTDSKTRTIFFRVRNAHGGESELRLISIQHDDEIKPRLKSTRFSAIWFSELSNFRDPNVFRVSWQQLRMYHLKPWQHLWIGDTNPSDEGEDSWIYKLWYKRKVDLLTTSQGDMPSEFALSLRKLTFTLADNLVLTQEETEVMRQLYSDDPGELEREFEGKWTKGHGNRGKHFSDLFSRSVHVIGGEIGEEDYIEVSSSTDTLMVGWDLGSVVNHAAVIVEKRIVLAPDGKCEWPVFCVLDSLRYTDERKTIGELGLEVVEKMDMLEGIYKRKFHWQHWSDDTAITVWRPSSGSFDYMEILSVTNGRIRLDGVPKPANSIAARVRLIRRLLRERRLYVSSRCTDVIDMFLNCKQGGSQKEYVEWNEQKHTFDALSYVLFMEAAADLELVCLHPSAKRNNDLSLELLPRGAV